MRQTEGHTAVEIDSDAKAAAQAANVGDSTETNLEPAHGPDRGDRVDERSLSAELTAQTDLSSGRTSDTMPAHLAFATEQMNAMGSSSAPVAVLSPPPGDDNDAAPATPMTTMGSMTAQPAVLAPPSGSGDAGAARPSRASQPSSSTASTSLPPPKATQVATSGPSPACPQCESPMAWVDEHLRFYCRQCRMYF